MTRWWEKKTHTSSNELSNVLKNDDSIEHETTTTIHICVGAHPHLLPWTNPPHQVLFGSARLGSATVARLGGCGAAWSGVLHEDGAARAGCSGGAVRPTGPTRGGERQGKAQLSALRSASFVEVFENELRCHGFVGEVSLMPCRSYRSGRQWMWTCALRGACAWPPLKRSKSNNTKSLPARHGKSAHYHCRGSSVSSRQSVALEVELVPALLPAPERRPSHELLVSNLRQSGGGGGVS